MLRAPMHRIHAHATHMQMPHAHAHATLMRRYVPCSCRCGGRRRSRSARCATCAGVCVRRSCFFTSGPSLRGSLRSASRGSVWGRSQRHRVTCRCPAGHSNALLSARRPLSTSLSLKASLSQSLALSPPRPLSTSLSPRHLLCPSLCSALCSTLCSALCSAPLSPPPLLCPSLYFSLCPSLLPTTQRSSPALRASK